MPLAIYFQRLVKSIYSFKVPKNRSIVTLTHCHSSNMPSLQRKYNTLENIIKKTPARYICPKCLEAFPRSDVLRNHFRNQDDDIHKGLDMVNINFKKFLSCYQASLGSDINARDMPTSPKCFELFFIVEHYENDTGLTMTSGQQPVSRLLPRCSTETNI